jgi:hypothetical protein
MNDRPKNADPLPCNTSYKSDRKTSWYTEITNSTASGLDWLKTTELLQAGDTNMQTIKEESKDILDGLFTKNQCKHSLGPRLV